MPGYYNDNYSNGKYMEHMTNSEAEGAENEMSDNVGPIAKVTGSVKQVYESLNLMEIIRRAFKYLIVGSAVALAVYLIPKRELEVQDVAMIAIVGAASFAILDMYAPSIGMSARQGAGFGLGAQLVGWNA
jgi:hypothetical protein